MKFCKEEMKCKKKNKGIKTQQSLKLFGEFLLVFVLRVCTWVEIHYTGV